MRALILISMFIGFNANAAEWMGDKTNIKLTRQCEANPKTACQKLEDRCYKKNNAEACLSYGIVRLSMHEAFGAIAPFKKACIGGIQMACEYMRQVEELDQEDLQLLERKKKLLIDSQ